MIRKLGISLCALSLLTSCSYNPLVPYNDTTGNASSMVVGAGLGATAAAVANASRVWIASAGLFGGAVGYYVTTLRFQSGGVVQAGGTAYQIGQRIGVYIPTDALFEPNTADFLPQAYPILDSAVTVLKRSPNNNLIISGGTSGFGRRAWELSLSERRAEKVAAYLWKVGMGPGSHGTRHITYIGYGDFFPLASDLHNKGIRENSRIQIVSYVGKVFVKKSRTLCQTTPGGNVP